MDAPTFGDHSMEGKIKRANEEINKILEKEGLELKVVHSIIYAPRLPSMPEATPVVEK